MISLIAAPQGALRSFDLVPADLSETVVSFSVTAELDVCDASSLFSTQLIGKNEHVMETLSSAQPLSAPLRYTMTAQSFCSQVLAIGNNNVNHFP
jgi:hypothetical protein